MAQPVSMGPPPVPRRARRRALWLRLGAAAVVLGSLVVDPSPIVLVLLLFVLVVPFEKLFPRHDQPFRRPRLGLDVGYALAQPALTGVSLVAGGIVAIGSLFWLPGLALRPVVTALPPLAQLLVGVLAFDLLIYWVHRWSHEVPFLWRFHSVHHSIETMDWVSAFRNHPIDGIILAPPIAFLLAAGFSLETTGVLTVLQIVTGIFLHANVRWRWRPLQRIIITPDFHHWHHANEPGAINSNYSVFLPVWDIIFGTWFMPKDRRPSVYGIDEYMPPTMVAQFLHPFRGLQKPTTVLRHPVRSTKRAVRDLRRGAGQIRRASRRRDRQIA